MLVIDRDISNFDKAVKKFKGTRYISHITLAKVQAHTLSSSMVREEIMKNGFTEKLKEYLYVDTIKKLQRIDLKKYWKK